MASSSTGSTLAFIAALLVICILVLLLLRYYLPLRSTPAYLTTPVFLALALPCSIILLVPIDLASNAVQDEDGTARGVWLPDAWMLVMWRIAYWLTFALTWFILPLVGDYADSGFRDPRRRMLDSFRSNLRYQLIVLVTSAAVLVYYIFQTGFDGTSLKGTAIALAYAWGLILAIYLMGHGLVALPRRMYRTANVANRLRHLQSQAPIVHGHMVEATEDLDVLEAQVIQLRQRKTGTARDFQGWIEDLADTSDILESRIAHMPRARMADTNVPAVITEKYLAELSRRLKRARHKRIRFIAEWDLLVQKAQDDQAVLDAVSSKQLTFLPARTSTLLSRLSPLTPYARYRLHATLLPAARLATSGILALASACIIWSEVFKAIPAISVVGRSCVHHPSATARGKIGFAGQVMAAAWLCYMCAAALISVSEVKVWGNRALVRRNTYLESATWYATQVAKLTVPLSYNFITFLPKDIYEETAFHRFLGKLINLTPLGGAFSLFFPIFILIPVCATAFGLYVRIKRIAGFGILDDETEDNPSGFGTGGWREGRALLERERLDGHSGRHGEMGHDGSEGLGLSGRDTSPSRQARSHVPYTDREDVGAAVPRRQQPPASRSPTLLRTEQHDANADGPSDGFFDDFAHRMRNTFESVDRPKIKLNFSKPKWLTTSGGGLRL